MAERTPRESGSGKPRIERASRPVNYSSDVARHVARFLRISSRPPAVVRRAGTRHATWMELFFDLVYVVAVAELGVLLHDDLSLTGFLGFTGLFLVVWWTWLGFTTYADQFDTDDLVHRVGLAAVMFGVIILTATIRDAFDGGSAAFAIAYLVLRVLYIGMYARAWFSLPELRPFLAYVVAATTVSAGVWAASLFVPEPIRFGVWGLSFLISIVVSLVGYVGFENIPRPTSHLNERLGLFTILVLGETVLAVAVGTSGTDWTLSPALTALVGFLVALSLWWMYFRNVDEWLIDRAYKHDAGPWSRSRETSFAHVLAHFVVFVGIVTAGVGIAVAIEVSTAGHALEPNGVAAVAGGIAIFLLGVGFVHRAMLEPIHDGVFLTRMVGALLLVSICVLGLRVSPLALVVFVAGLLVVLNTLEGLSAYRRTLVAGVDG